MLEVSLRVPASASVVKRRANERLHVEAVVAAEDASSVIVECWAPFHDAAGERAAAYPLRFSHASEEGLVFSNEITLPYTGCFPFGVRARTRGAKTWSWASGSTYCAELWVDPEWVYQSIVYNAFVRYFGAREVEGDGRIHAVEPGTFADVEAELDRLVAMGIDVLYLNPVYMIGELMKNYNPHDLLPEYLQPGCPYSIKDYKSIDPELSFGEDDASHEHPFDPFRRLVEEAHARGIRVFMDLVFNHSAHDAVFQRLHPEWFLYKEDVTSLEGPYIYPEELRDGKPWGDPKHTFAPYDQGHWWGDTAQLNWNNLKEYPEFVMPHVAPNEPPENPTIRDMYRYFVNVVTFWIREFGIDGFRCDVAYRVPLDFWRSCIRTAQRVAREEHPHNGSVDGSVVFIAEDYHVRLRELLEAGFTAVYGDLAARMTTATALAEYLDFMYNISGDNVPDGSLFFIFPECHDFHRSPQRYATPEELADVNANKSRWTLVACLPGIPMIFNGFEKVEWEPVSLFSYSKVDWESDKDVSAHVARVNDIRSSEVALQRGRYHFLHTSEGLSDATRVFSFARILGDECVLVAVNLHVTEMGTATLYLPPELPIDYARPYVLVDRLSGERFERSGSELYVELPAGDAHIFRVEQEAI